MYDLKACLGAPKQQIDMEHRTALLLHCHFELIRRRAVSRWDGHISMLNKTASDAAAAIDNLVDVLGQFRAIDHRFRKLTRKRRALRIGKMRFVAKL
jgi:hypothetical protein